MDQPRDEGENFAALFLSIYSNEIEAIGKQSLNRYILESHDDFSDEHNKFSSSPIVEISSFGSELYTVSDALGMVFFNR